MPPGRCGLLVNMVNSKDAEDLVRQSGRVRFAGQYPHFNFSNKAMRARGMTRSASPPHSRYENISSHGHNSNNNTYHNSNNSSSIRSRSRSRSSSRSRSRVHEVRRPCYSKNVPRPMREHTNTSSTTSSPNSTVPVATASGSTFVGCGTASNNFCESQMNSCASTPVCNVQAVQSLLRLQKQQRDRQEAEYFSCAASNDGEICYNFSIEFVV